MQKVIAIMLFDDYSKVDVKTDIADFSLQGIIFINSLSELSDSLLEKTNNVIVLSSFFKNATSFSEITLFKQIYDINYFFIGNDKNLLAILQKDGIVFDGDITMLDFDMIESAICSQNEKIVVNEDLENNIYKDSYELANKIMLNAEEYDIKLTELANSYMALYSKFYQTFHSYVSLKSEVSSVKIINRKLIEENENFATGVAELMLCADNLNKNLTQYEYCMSKPIYEKLQVHSYSNRPRIIYLKVYEEIKGFDQFVETLVNSLMYQERLSVKVLRLYDNCSAKFMKVLPANYTTISSTYLLQDLICNQYLCKLGDYRDVLDILLTNRENLDVLIIIDCKSFEDTVVNDYTVFYNICQNKEHALLFDLLLENTVVSFSEDDSDLVWNGYDLEDMDISEQFIYLSSRKAITSILKSFKLYSDTM